MEEIIQQLKAANQKAKDDLWNAIEKWHSMEKDLVK